MSSKLLKSKMILFNKNSSLKRYSVKRQRCRLPIFLFPISSLLSFFFFASFTYVYRLFYLSFPYFIYVFTVFLFLCFIYLSVFPMFLFPISSMSLLSFSLSMLHLSICLFYVSLFFCISLYSHDTLVIVFLLYLDTVNISLPFFLGSTFT
jgi:hypothetical protein